MTTMLFNLFLIALWTMGKIIAPERPKMKTASPHTVPSISG